jgi:hypothetical protein
MRKVLFWIILGITAVLAACGGGDNATTVNQVINNPSFTIKLVTASLNGFQGSSGSVNVQLERKNGFAGIVELSLKAPPAGVTSSKVSFGTASEVQLQVQVARSVPVGTVNVTVQGSSGSLSATANLGVNVQAAVSSSQDLIQAALKAGRIDLGTSLEYRAYALFGDARLPKEFVGSGSGREDNGLFIEIASQKSILSPTVLEKLEPYLVRPNDPKSFFSKGLGLQATSSSLHSAAVLDPCTTPERKWDSVRSTKYPLRVWGVCKGIPAEDLVARGDMLKTLAILSKSYEPMTALMGTPLPDSAGDNAIDFYITPRGIQVPRPDTSDADPQDFAGITFPDAENGSTSSAFVVLPAIQVLKIDYPITVIHEFFHVLQYAHNAKEFSYRFWFTEASAEWAGLHFNRTVPVEPQVNAEVNAGRFSDFLSSELSLLRTTGEHEYDSYIWPFFMAKKIAPSVIGQVFKQLESSNSLEDGSKAMDSVFSFKEHFRDFAYRNLNERKLLPGDALPREKRYISTDSTFPDEVVPTYDSVELKPKDEKVFGGELEPLTAKYYDLAVNDEKIKQVVIDLTGAKLDGIDVDALVKVNGTWESGPRNLNGKTEVQFCRTRASEKLNDLILVLSNHLFKPDGKLKAEIKVKALELPCPSTVVATVEEINEDTGLEGDVFSLRKSEWRFEFEESVPPRADQIGFKFVSGQVTQDELGFRRSDIVCKLKRDFLSSIYANENQGSQKMFRIYKKDFPGSYKAPYYFFGQGDVNANFQNNWNDPSCGLSGPSKYIFGFILTQFGAGNLPASGSVTSLFAGPFPTLPDGLGGTTSTGVITNEYISGSSGGGQKYKSVLKFTRSDVVITTEFTIYP